MEQAEYEDQKQEFSRGSDQLHEIKYSDAQSSTKSHNINPLLNS